MEDILACQDLIIEQTTTMAFLTLRVAFVPLTKKIEDAIWSFANRFWQKNKCKEEKTYFLFLNLTISITY